LINNKTLKPGSVAYSAGNAATPQVLLEQLAKDLSIKQMDLYGVLLVTSSPGKAGGFQL
jgi:hypothetical protein